LAKVSKIFPGQKNLFIFAVIIAAVFFASANPGLIPGVRRAAANIISFPGTVLKSVSWYFSSKRVLLDENKKLRNDNDGLHLEIARLDEVNNENVRLREILDIRKQLPVNTIAAEVIAREPNDWTGAFMINKGTKDGLKNECAVCSMKGLLGKVVDPGEDTSFVVLLTHPAFKVGATIKDTRVNGIVVGDGKGMARMLYIPMDANIEKGAVVVTSALSRIFPRGILIGKVVSVGVSNTGLYKYAVIKPFANFFDEEEVLCVL